MKKNILKSIVISTIVFIIISCSKDCEPKLDTCNETPPTDELCQAAFQRWFFNKEENKCEQIGYSGCSQKGFETLEECEQCECN
jgi:hypothetical protein